MGGLAWGARVGTGQRQGNGLDGWERGFWVGTGRPGWHGVAGRAPGSARRPWERWTGPGGAPTQPRYFPLPLCTGRSLEAPGQPDGETAGAGSWRRGAPPRPGAPTVPAAAGAGHLLPPRGGAGAGGGGAGRRR